MKMVALVFMFFGLNPLCGCAEKAIFPPIEGVTRIEVIANSKDHLKTITGAHDIAEIISFVNERRDGWGGLSDMGGVPIPVITLDFYSEEQFRGHFGIGPGFFETQRANDFASRRASSNEEEQIKALLHIPEAAYERK